MDIEFIKNQIYHLDEKEKRILPGEHITADVLNILQDGKTADRNACFAPTTPGDLFTVDMTCSKCQSAITKKISKTSLFAYLQKHKDYYCDGCTKILELEKRESEMQSKIYQENYEKQKVHNTKKYIKDYLDPDAEWDSSTTWRDRQKLILQADNIDHNTIANHIKGMLYKDFLKTPYWKAIAMYKKYKMNYKCDICGNEKTLSAHHKSYKRHGYEHRYTVINEDLIVLCKDCHAKFHNKLPPT